MQKHLIIVVALISLLCAITYTHNIESHSGMQRSFSQRFGVHGYLLHAATRFGKYEFEKERCCTKKKQKKRIVSMHTRRNY